MFYQVPIYDSMGRVRLRKVPGRIVSLIWEVLVCCLRCANNNRNNEMYRRNMIVELVRLSKFCEGGQGRRYLVQVSRP